MSTDRAMHFEPGKLWSLWDMHRFPLSEINEHNVFITSVVTREVGNFTTEPLGQQGLAAIYELIDKFGVYRPFAPQAVKFLDKMRAGLKESSKGGDVIRAITSATEVLHNELAEFPVYGLIPSDAHCLDHPALFGDEVLEAFPSAAMDIQEAGSCFALERYNGAVFHAIEAAERGLRVLAKDRRVTAVQFQKAIPLDQAQWGILIRGLRTEIAKINSWPPGAPKDAADQFYNQALLEASALNDGWRRHLMHARGKAYLRDEALAVLGHCDRFMRKLAVRLGENRRSTPLVWKSALA